MTVYFINEGMGPSNSGIEHAEFDRARTFRKNQVPFKIVTTVWLPKLHDILPMFNIKDNESINMFDFYQKATDLPKNPAKPEDIDFGVDVDADKTGHIYNVQFDGHFMGRIVVDDNNNVERVEYFDLFGNLYKVSYYDTRGFISLNQWYSPDNKIEVEVWLDVDGKPVIEKTYTPNRHGKMIESWKVNNNVYQDIQELRLDFYNKLNEYGDNMFIIDRTNVAEWQLTQLDRPAYLAFMLHNHQTSDSRDPNAQLLNDNYEWSLANMDKWNCVISATPQQTRDLKNRWGGDNYYTIPVGVIPDSKFQEEHIPMNKRKRHSMLATARIASEKGMDKMIEALAIAQKTIPDLTLDLYGYVDHSNNDIAMKRINDAMEKLTNKDAVTIHGHSKNVKQLHEEHQVYLIFSSMEGFNIALMEAQSNGMVGLVNDVYYGPNEIIKDGENGFMVDYEDVETYAKRMVELFSDDKLLQHMSDKSYELSERYSEKEVWKAWEKVFVDYDVWKDTLL